MCLHLAFPANPRFSSQRSSPALFAGPPFYTSGFRSLGCIFDGARRKIECEHGRSIYPKESLIFGRCTPTIPSCPSTKIIFVPARCTREAGRNLLFCKGPREKARGAHNKADRASLMRHNGPGKYA